MRNYKRKRPALTLDEARRVRAMRAEGRTVNEIAAEFEVGCYTVHKILEGVSHVEPAPRAMASWKSRFYGYAKPRAGR